jgi:glycosyltransferase involved in cell wall biosynthesis
MKILIALTYYRPHYSGLTIHAEREARALVERGNEVTVLTSRFDPSLPVNEVRDGVNIVRCPVLLRISKGVIMPSMPFKAWKLGKQVEVIHLHAPQFDAAFIASIARLLRKPVVLTYHCDLRLPSGFVHRLANRVSNVANHISAQKAQRIVHNTRDYAEISPFLKHYLSKVVPVYPPVEVMQITEADTVAFRNKFSIQPGQRIIGMAARLATEKGVEYLAEAIPAILHRFPTARVLFVGPHENIVGEEQYALHLKPLLESLGAHWSFLGILSPIEMSAFFHECEVTVLPSINSTESYGLVQVESMTCGTPVIASDLPGMRVPVLTTGMGIIVPPMNAPAIAEAIIKVLEYPATYQGNSDSIVTLSTPHAVAIEYEKVFTTAIQLNQKANMQKSPEGHE